MNIVSHWKWERHWALTLTSSKDSLCSWWTCCSVGMMISREITRRWLQHTPDVQSRTHELHLCLPPQLQGLYRLVPTQVSGVRWDEPLLFLPAAPSCLLLGCHGHFECVGAASERLPAEPPRDACHRYHVLVLQQGFKLRDCRVRRAFQKPFSPCSCPPHLNHSWQKFA